MKEKEIRQALAICEAAEAAFVGWSKHEDNDYPECRDALIAAMDNEYTGYAATLRELLEAREIIKEVLHYVETYDEDGEAAVARAEDFIEAE